jgi:long-chain acyl-CoA synthetase
VVNDGSNVSIAEHKTELRHSTASFKSIADLWHHRIRSTPDSEAMLRRVDGEWVPITWARAGERVRAIANGLLAMGLQPQQRCAIIADTAIEWILVDVAIVCARGATTTLFPSSTTRDVAYILADCEAQIVFCDTWDQAQRLRDLRSELPSVAAVVVFDASESGDDWVMTLPDLEQRGRAWASDNPTAYDEGIDAIQPSDMATLMYTSGTTGQPKGVVLTHDAWVYESEALDRMGIITAADRQFLVLPLSHVFAKVLAIVFIRLGVPTAIDSDIDNLLRNLTETRPTWVGAVPRVFEKAYDRAIAEVREAGPARRKLFNWALGVGRQVSALRRAGGEPTGLLKMRYDVADRLVFTKIKARFGGRLRFFISGGAPLAEDIGEFFHAVDVLILEGYGLTESSAATCVNTPADVRFGTVGRPVPGCEIRIEEDGEVLIRSRGVMAGYWRQPEDTSRAITPDGWLRTGDIGMLHNDGHLEITGRKKDMIVTAGGKNIAPAPVQGLLVARYDLISHALIVGDRRPYCVALLAIDFAVASKWARDRNISFADYADLASKPQLREVIQTAITDVNRTLPSFEAIRRFALVPADFTVANGLLTPSLKVRRLAVEAHYAELLDQLYDGSAR